MSRTRLAILVLLVFAASSVAQPSFWIALNFEASFQRDGTVVVTAFLHPFSVEGESLYGNETIEEAMREGWNATLMDILLMFTNHPSTIKYRVLREFERRDDAVVYCDVYGYGNFSALKGAYLTSVQVFLNTSEFTSVRGDLVTVMVRDSYTSRDPRSWIDVMRIKYDEGILVNYSWRPESAEGPVLEAPGLLEWRNIDERVAPDFYIFILKLENFTVINPEKGIEAYIQSISATGDEVIALSLIHI